MTDLEMTKLCAEAIGITAAMHPIRGTIQRWWYMDGNVERQYGPLWDDAQAMALVKKLNLNIQSPYPDDLEPSWQVYSGANTTLIGCYRPDLNRAIVECVAKMQAAK